MKLMATALCFLLISNATHSLEASIVQRTFKIMAIGDSITAGFHGTPAGSYRQTVQERLTEAGIMYDFVGGERRGDPNVFDPDHEGFSGITAFGQLGRIAEPLQTYTPDIALVLLGTNSHFGSPDADYESVYQALSDAIQENSPGASIIFSTVPKFGYEAFGGNFPDSVDFRNEEVFPAINRAIEAVAAKDDKIAVVDFFSEIDIEEDLAFDGVHPNLFGQEKLGNLFADELIAQISVGQAVPEPNSVVIVLALLNAFALIRRRSPSQN